GISPSAASANTFIIADREGGASSGLYRTTDGGQTWASTGFVGSTYDVVGDPSNAQIVYIMQSNATAVYRSLDGGTTFAPFNTGLAFNGGVQDLAYAPGSPAKLLFSTTVGSFATPLYKIADVNSNGVVDIDDLLAVINSWGPCPIPCPPSC